MHRLIDHPVERENEMKTPDKFERRPPLSKEQKQARKERREAAARVATAENAKAAEQFAKNRERLKAERLAREAGATTQPSGEAEEQKD
jgi:hypothetical protein